MMKQCIVYACGINVHDTWFSWNEMEITEIEVVGTRSGNSFCVFSVLPKKKKFTFPIIKCIMLFFQESQKSRMQITRQVSAIICQRNI
jgi:hypothetical protein